MSIRSPRVDAIVSSLLFLTIVLNFSGVALAAGADLDPTFDTDGKVTTAFGAVDAKANAVVVQPDGKIVAAGFARVGTGSGDFANDFALVRYNIDGTLDTTFDTDGKVTTAFGTSIDQVHAVVLQPDGKIVAAGWALIGSKSNFALARYNANGSLDTTFDSDGKVTTAIGTNTDQAFAVALQPDGKIVAAGVSRNAMDDFAVVRYNTDGSLDTSFDMDGKVTNDFGANIDKAQAVAIQSDGKIVLAGYASIVSGFFDYALIRYNPDGSLDTSFDGDGKVSTAFADNNDEAFAIALQPDGKIIAAGRSFMSGSGYHFTLARFNPNGSLDSSFDTDGRVTTNFNVGGFDTAYALKVQTNGKIVAVGSAAVGSGFYDVALARYNPDGSLDTTFDTDGRLTMSFGGTDEEAFAAAVQADGKIVVAGYARISNLFLFAVARFEGDPVANPSAPYDFDGDGKTDIAIFRPGVAEWWINRSSNGTTFAAQFGATTDKLAPGDYTGDGKADIAIWRPSSGEWFILRSEDSSYFSFPFGTNGDTPMPADYDSDGKVDAAVFRASSATWFIRRSFDGGTTIEGFGLNGDVPVVADYDGDGKADIAIYRPSLGQWWVKHSSAGVIALTFGTSSDKPVQGDYTGDEKADVAFWRPSTGEWYILRSQDFSYYSQPFGTTGDVPSPGDYDGDGKFDPTVFRPSNSIWFSQRSTAGTLIQQFGSSGDAPVPSAFVP